MLVKPIEYRPSRHPAHALGPLGLEQCNDLAVLIAGLMPDWSVELHYDVQCKPMIVILPVDLDDATGPTLVVYGDETGFHLEELLWDTCRKLGDYQLWTDVANAVRIRLVWQMPLATTLH